MSFTQQQLEKHHALWNQMTSHRFLLETRDGTIADDIFAQWMKQDYLFVRAAIPFISALVPKGPLHHWKPHSDVVAMLNKEMELFEERANLVGISFEGVEPWFINHAYIQFMMATAYTASYPEAYTLLYTAEKAYHDAWLVVKEGLDPQSKWYPFVENWASEEFGQYVDYLQGELDTMAADVGTAEYRRMESIFELTVKYEISFWEMAYTGAQWPGIQS